MSDWLDGYFENKPIVDATVSPSGGGVIVADGSVTNAKLANVADNTIKSNATGSTAAPSDMTVGINTIVGRGPTGSIDDLAVQAGLTITDTTIGRAAFTGDVTASADSNALTIANNAVTTAKILDANVTTAKVALNAIGNARMAKMATNTVKGNATGSTADSVDMTISGGLYTDGVSVLKSKSGIGWHYTFDSTAGGTPATGTITLNDSITVASITTLRIYNTTIGGRNIDTYINTWLNGRITIKSNNAAGTAFLIMDMTGVPNDSGSYWTISAVPLTGVGVMPTNGEELVVHYEAIGSSVDVMAVNTVNKVLRHDDQGNIIDENDVVLSGTSVVTNYAALVALDTTEYADFAVKVTNGLNKSIWSPNGSSWLPVNGSYLHDRSNISVKRFVACNGAITWDATDSPATPGFVRLTSSGDHGLTSASEGSSLYLTNSPTNWTAGTFHNIVTRVSTTVLDTSTPFVASMGVPTFAGVTTAVPVLVLTIPALRANSRYMFETTLSALDGGTTNKIRCNINSTEITSATFTATTNNTLPFRSGFKNLNSVSSQSGLYGQSSTGFAAGNEAVTTAIDTSTGTVTFTIYLECSAVNCWHELPGYTLTIQG